ncbi:hypothetical protein ISS37_07660 [candidate division KSB1 bacterium]|nr:hypothetical protein [candidate division KSB1 bacterium]
MVVKKVYALFLSREMILIAFDSSRIFRGVIKYSIAVLKGLKSCFFINETRFYDSDIKNNMEGVVAVIREWIEGEEKERGIMP